MSRKVKRIKKGTSNHEYLGWNLAVLFFTFLTFSPSLSNEFVNWDDDRNLYENELVLNLSWHNVKELFSTTIIGNYNPLSNLLLSVEHHLFSGSDQYHALLHLVNLMLHLICVFFVFRLGSYLGLKKWGIIILSLLFAIHPMRVESVAWITEIKDVLYGAFFFGGLVLYARRHQNKSTTVFQWGVFALFFIGLFAKIQMVCFPLALVCIDYIQGRKDLWSSVRRHWIYFLGSLIFGTIGLMALKNQGSLDTNHSFTLIERLFFGAYSWVVYLVKSIIPYRMSPLYPYPPVLSWWHYLSMIPFVGSLIGIYVFWKKNWEVLFFGSAFFTVNIVFLLQILGAGQGYLADRFTYVAYFGLFFIYAYFLEKWLAKPSFKKWLPYALILAFASFGYLTFQQTKIWKNSGTLWTHVIKYYKTSTLPFGNRANYYRDIGEKEKALEDYSTVIRLAPGSPKPYNSRAKLYFSMNQDQKALEDYKKAVVLAPKDPEYIINMGAAYAKLGIWDQALAAMNKGLEIDPRNLNGLLNRSLVYQELRQMDHTLEDLKTYLKYDPNNPEIWYEAGRVQRVLGMTAESMKSLNQALKINPRLGSAHYERSILFFQSGQWDRARNDVQRARQLGVRVDPEYERRVMGK